jgi:hypothetical protein
MRRDDLTAEIAEDAQKKTERRREKEFLVLILSALLSLCGASLICPRRCGK